MPPSRHDIGDDAARGTGTGYADLRSEARAGASLPAQLLGICGASVYSHSLVWAVQVSLMEIISAQPLLEARFGRPADERMNVCRAQIAIAYKQFEDLDVAARTAPCAVLFRVRCILDRRCCCFCSTPKRADVRRCSAMRASGSPTFRYHISPRRAFALAFAC